MNDVEYVLFDKKFLDALSEKKSSSFIRSMHQRFLRIGIDKEQQNPEFKLQKWRFEEDCEFNRCWNKVDEHEFSDEQQVSAYVLMNNIDKLLFPTNEFMPKHLQFWSFSKQQFNRLFTRIKQEFLGCIYERRCKYK